MDIEKIKKEVEELCIKLNRPIHKKDFNIDNGFLYGYTTYANHGLRLTDIKFFQILYYQNPKLCSNCGNVIEYQNRHGKYCSKKCSAVSTNSRLPRRKKGGIDKYQRNKILNSKIKKLKSNIKKLTLIKEKQCFILRYNYKKENHFCLFCKQYFEENKNFCNNDCLAKNNFMNSFLDWYYSETYINKYKNPLIKQFVITMRGYQCSRCHISEYNGKPLTLHLEHIDGDATNNTKENVCLLCPNCHALTPTYKGKNIGNGKREWRKKRYNEGKSY